MKMDAINTTINYQPTGVYAQFAKNPMLLNQEALKKQQAAESLRSKNEVPFSQKAAKFAKRAGILGGLALVGLGVFYYLKGMKAIKLKEKHFPNVTEETIGQWMNNKFSDEQRDFYSTVWNEGNQYLNGTVGKIHNGIQAVRTFFRNNFYNY